MWPTSCIVTSLRPWTTSFSLSASERPLPATASAVAASAAAHEDLGAVEEEAVELARGVALTGAHGAPGGGRGCTPRHTRAVAAEMWD